jgi:hypothetical protein
LEDNGDVTGIAPELAVTHREVPVVVMDPFLESLTPVSEGTIFSRVWSSDESVEGDGDL